ncbi:MAG: DUF1275 domain-containing protein [Ignavibacteria bacterium]|nr:DUF1275 domain-containing protein [Ignavibacteria bacterium]
MFRHKGKSRNFKHNLGIASLLAFVAGIVNVVGFLAIQKLTTNVTGHFALMVEEALKVNFDQTIFYFLYVFFFLLGAFSSNFTIEVTNKITDKYIFILPVFIEVAILTFVGLQSRDFVTQHPNFIAFSLLFSMGLQNSLVTTISSSVVRTTHLTGLFTDLGIEFSQLFFFKSQEQRNKLVSSIKLRITIIVMFFLGGVTAGLVFQAMQIQTLLIASVTLIIGLTVDYISLRMRLTKRGTKQDDE